MNITSTSADDSVIAIGINDEKLNKHQIEVLQYDQNNVWKQLGSSLIVPLEPFSVKSYNLTADGSVLAVCLRGEYFQPGKVKVRKYNEEKGDWSQEGNDILINV